MVAETLKMLQGKKTYIVSCAIALTGLAQMLGWIGEDDATQITDAIGRILDALAIATLRAGIAKAAL